MTEKGTAQNKNECFAKLKGFEASFKGFLVLLDIGEVHSKAGGDSRAEGPICCED